MSDAPQPAANIGSEKSSSTVRSAMSASRQRYTNAAITAAAGFASKAISAVAVYVMVRLLYRALGDVNFGVWSTCHSLLAMTAFADFGIGNGMLNAVAAANARRSKRDVAAIISSGTVMLAGVASIATIVLAIAWPLVKQMVITSDVRDADLSATAAGLLVFIVYALLSMPLGTGDRVATALQEGFVIHGARAVSQVVAVAAVYAATSGRSPFWVVCAATLVPGLLAAVGTWLCIVRHRPWLVPRPARFDVEWARRLFRSGSGFFAVQMAALLGFNLDILIVAKGCSAAAAADFALASRLFSVALVLGTIVLTPLWPAYADAAASGDFRWASRALIRSLGFAAGVGLAVCGAIYAVRKPLVSLWLGQNANLPDDLVAVTGIWTGILLVGTALAMFWNGMHWLRLQWMLGLTFAVVALPLKAWAAYAHWPVGVVLSNILCFGCLSLVPGLVWTVRYLSSQASSQPTAAV